MPAHRFTRYELRTLDLDAARAFYADVVGPDLFGSDITLSVLPERARAHGAPPHWLGQLGVPAPRATVERWLALGARPLGPGHFLDPFGAVVAIGAEAPAPMASDRIAWHLLHTADHRRAFAVYQQLFGWLPIDLPDLGPELEAQQGFAWDDSGRVAGSIASTARLPHIHPHWLFAFRVGDIDRAVGRVRELGGTALTPTPLPNGDRIAVCEDAQRAAFGLYEPSS